MDHNGVPVMGLDLIDDDVLAELGLQGLREGAGSPRWRQEAFVFLGLIPDPNEQPLPQHPAFNDSDSEGEESIFSEDTGYFTASFLDSSNDSDAQPPNQHGVIVIEPAETSVISDSRSSLGERLNDFADMDDDEDDGRDMAMRELEEQDVVAREFAGLPVWDLVSERSGDTISTASESAMDVDEEPEVPDWMEDEEEYDIKKDDDFWFQLNAFEYEYEWRRVYGDQLMHPAGPVPTFVLLPHHTLVDACCLIRIHFALWDSEIRPPIHMLYVDAHIHREDPEGHRMEYWLQELGHGFMAMQD